MADTMPMEKDTSKPKKVKQKSADSGISREEYMKKEAAKAKAAKDEQRAKAEEEREKEKAFKIAELKRKVLSSFRCHTQRDTLGLFCREQ